MILIYNLHMLSLTNISMEFDLFYFINCQLSAFITEIMGLDFGKSHGRGRGLTIQVKLE